MYAFLHMVVAGWVRGLDEPAVAPLLEALGRTLDSCVEIGLGYLSLDRPSGTLSGGEAQRTKMIRHLGSLLTDVTYVFDEPTAGLHAHDVQRGGIYVLDEPTGGLHLADIDHLLVLLDQLVESGKSVIVIEHRRAVIAHANWMIDLGPGAGQEGGRVVFEGTPADLVAACSTLTGQHLPEYVAVVLPVPLYTGLRHHAQVVTITAMTVWPMMPMPPLARTIQRPRPS